MAGNPNQNPRLLSRYESEIVGQLQGEFKYKCVSEVPRIEKVVVNMGVGAATDRPSLLEGAVTDLEIITGQKPIVTRATK